MSPRLKGVDGPLRKITIMLPSEIYDALENERENQGRPTIVDMIRVILRDYFIEHPERLHQQRLAAAKAMNEAYRKRLKVKKRTVRPGTIYKTGDPL